jgi:ubiquinone/menaquinone biosynthesis C-methylase UbiE
LVRLAGKRQESDFLTKVVLRTEKRKGENMSDLAEVYNSKAEKYERLIEREDYQGNILRALEQIRPMQDLDVIDTGAGTGRLACMLAPLAHSIQVFDVSESMLAVAASRLQASGLSNWSVQVADHRSLPAGDESVDVVVSGWSVVYTAIWNPERWQEELRKALTELERVLRPGGSLILLETMGTVYVSPNPPADLLDYFSSLEQAGFSSTWIRTDYQFGSLDEARELTSFFFGDEMIGRVISIDPVILPECTGIWWFQKNPAS